MAVQEKFCFSLLFRMKPIFVLVFLLSRFALAHSILDPNDFLALQSIRKSLQDMPGSSFFKSWDFTSDPCNFSGVYCFGGRVITLNLGDPRASSTGLTGRLHPSIGKLSALTEFTVVPGSIMGHMPQTISDLKYLRFLAISRNYISGEIPPGLGLLRRLETLDLSYNQINGTIPLSIGTLPALANLILSRNHLTGSIPPFFSKTLTRLDLKQNRLDGWLPRLGFPPSLQHLSLSGNQLTGPIGRVIGRLNRLNYLDLSMNQFVGAIPPILFTFPIATLQLQRNQLSGPVQPSGPVRIQTVDLSFNRLSGEISPSFSSVQILYLNNNRFTGEVPACFVDRILSASIQILYLQHNYLTGIEMNPTVAIPLSASLCLQYNCMVLPVETPCPLKAGLQKTRPTEQCRRRG